MPECYDVIELAVDLPEHRLLAGMQGTIVECHSAGAYDVELVDQGGETRAWLTLRPHQFIVVWRASTGAPVPVADQVAALVETLPQEVGQEVLDFARFLRERQRRSAMCCVPDSEATA